VKVSVWMRGRSVAVENVSDARIASALKEAGRDLGTKLATATCPEHGKTPWNVRLHFDKNGAGDLKYESCCEQLGKTVASILG